MTVTGDDSFPVNLWLPHAGQEREHVSNEAVKGLVSELLKSHNLDMEDIHTAFHLFVLSFFFPASSEMSVVRSRNICEGLLLI